VNRLIKLISVRRYIYSRKNSYQRLLSEDYPETGECELLVGLTTYNLHLLLSYNTG